MKKNRRLPLGRMLTIALAGAAIAVTAISSAHAGKPTPAAAAQGEGRLRITRSATLGAYAVGLSIDGKQVATINYNGRYDAPLSAGPHVLSVIPIPNRMAGKPRETKITVAPGRTYAFTAKRDNDDYILK